MKDMILVFIYCFIATYFFSLLMNVPANVLAHCSVIGSVGYILYLICKVRYTELFGFFIATLAIALMGELSARKIKMPATIFIFPGLIPIVPGLGLYETMLAFVQGRIESGLEIGVKTLSNIAAMAIAMAIISFAVTYMSDKFKNKQAR